MLFSLPIHDDLNPTGDAKSVLITTCYENEKKKRKERPLGNPVPSAGCAVSMPLPTPPFPCMYPYFHNNDNLR